MTKPKGLRPQSLFWTPAKLKTLEDLCAEQRYSFQELAEILGTTKGSVAGKISRHKLKNRPNPEPRSYVVRIKKQIAFDVDKWFRERTPVVDEPRPWLERKFGQCAFPLDYPDGIYSCCKPAGTKTYCEDHCAIMYDNWKPARPRPPQLKTEGRFA